MKTQSLLLLCVCVGFNVFVCAQAQDATLAFDPPYFAVGETVKITCKPKEATTAWDKISMMTLSVAAAVKFTVTKDCKDPTVANPSEERMSVAPFQVELKNLVAADAATYTCLLAICAEVETVETSVEQKLTNLDLVYPVYVPLENNAKVISESKPVDIKCQLEKTSTVAGETLVIEHLLDGKTYSTKTFNFTENAAKPIDGAYKFTPDDTTKRGENTFECSNVNTNRPELKMTKVATTLTVEYAITSVKFTADEGNTVIPDGNEYKVDLTKTSLKVECSADGNPAPTYDIKQVKGSTDGVKIDSKTKTIAVNYGVLATDHLRFECQASNKYTVDASNGSTKSAVLNVYTNGSYRHEPTTLAMLLAALVIVKKLTV